MLDLDSLRIFVTAAETENFTRAAQRLHMSQPASANTFMTWSNDSASSCAPRANS